MGPGISGSHFNHERGRTAYTGCAGSEGDYLARRLRAPAWKEGQTSTLKQKTFTTYNFSRRGASCSPLFLVCAEHVRQLGGGSPLHNLMEVK